MSHEETLDKVKDIIDLDIIELKENDQYMVKNIKGDIHVMINEDGSPIFKNHNYYKKGIIIKIG